MNKQETWKFLKNEKAPNLLVFVHGLIGSSNTWFENHENTIVDYISKDKEICSHFDIALFSYYTTLTDFFTKKTYWLKSIFLRNKTNVYKRNLEISSISDLLESDLRFRGKDYEKIILIGHSMGGLVCKSFLLSNLKLKTIKNIDGLITLATPHRGANLAILGNSILNNPHIKNLQPLNDFIVNTNDNWIKHRDVLPKALYFYGKNDEIVAEIAAIPSVNIEGHEVVATNNDHSSITKPSNSDDIVLLAFREFVLRENEEISDVPELKFDFGVDKEKGEIVFKFLPESLSFDKMNYIRRRAQKMDAPFFKITEKRDLKNIESEWDKKSADDVINELIKQLTLKLEILLVTNHLLLSNHTSVLNIINNITLSIQQNNYTQNKTKIDIFLENPKIAFGVRLTQDDLIKSANTSTYDEAIDFFKNSIFLGFDIDNFSNSIIEKEVIPSFVEEIYRLIKIGKLQFDNFNWNYLGAYKVGLG